MVTGGPSRGPAPSAGRPAHSLHLPQAVGCHMYLERRFFCFAPTSPLHATQVSATTLGGRCSPHFTDGRTEALRGWGPVQGTSWTAKGWVPPAFLGWAAMHSAQWMLLLGGDPTGPWESGFGSGLLCPMPLTWRGGSCG